MTKAAFSIGRDDLLPALALASRAVASRNTIPILGNVLIALEAEEGGHRIDLTGTDLDCQFRASAPCTPANAVEFGGRSFTLPAAQLTEIVRKLPEKADIRFSADDLQCEVSAGRARFRLQILPAGDFPSMPEISASNRFAIEAAALKRMLGAVNFAISTEETRYYLNGIHWHAGAVDGTERLHAVATDGHRLARTMLPLPDGAGGMEPIIIPRRMVDLMKHILGDKGDVTVELGAGRIRMSTAGGALSSKLIDGTFPDYRRVIPAGNANRFTVDRAALSAAVDRVMTISTERGRAVKFAFDTNRLTLAASSPDAGSADEEMDVVEAEGEPVEIGFNGKYCAEMLAAAGDVDRVVFKLGDPGSPALVEPDVPGPETDRPLFVLMPMRV